ncbi:MAG: CehA/McbA family metallohydrolase [Mucilaginibacter sp.]
MKRLFIQAVFCWFALNAQAQPYHYYFGNIHAHSAYSDGNKDGATTKVLTPADCYKFAQSAQHFDFLGISEHNHLQAKMHLASYAKGLAEAKAANQDGKFVCLYGMEYGVIKNGGHVIIYGMDQLIGWEPGNYAIFSAKGDYSHLFQLVVNQPGAFATLAHPATTDYNNLVTKPYDPMIDQAVTGVAISSGPAFSEKEDYSDKAPVSYYGYFKKLLALGYSVGPTMDHDNHYTTFGHMSPTRTVLLSRVLSRDSLLAAYRAGRFYASEDWDTQVDFTVNGAPMGSHLNGVTNLQLRVTVTDPDPSDKVKTIQVWYGSPGSGQPAKSLKTVNGQNNFQIPYILKPGENSYFFLEITQADGDRIVTSPIWTSNKP